MNGSGIVGGIRRKQRKKRKYALHEEIVVIERGRVEDHACYVANYFENEAEYHGDHVAPRFMLDAKV